MLDLLLVGFIDATKVEVGRKENQIILVHTTCLIYIIGVHMDHYLGQVLLPGSTSQ